MDKTRKKRLKRYISWGLIAVLVLVLAVMPLMAAENAEDDGPVATIKSGTVESGSIVSRIHGGGTLAEDDAVNITIPSGVKLTEFLVENGDSVNEGDALASVDKISVMTAIAEVQDTLDYLDEEIASAGSESGATQIKAQTAGKVKLVYAEAGDNVQDVILEYGALAVLSLDGRMAVDIETEVSLRVGDNVLVTLSDGEEVTGRVESTLGDTIIVTIPDSGYDVDAPAQVSTSDGEYLGYGRLYIHNPWNATAFYGTVSTVNVAENDTVSAGKTLFTLSDTDHSTQYEILVGQRQEYEETMAELFKMYQSGTLTAPCDGVVSGVDENSAYLLSAEDTGWTLVLLGNTEEASGDGDDPEDTPENPGGGEEGNGGDGGEETPPETVSYTGLVAYVTAAEDGTLTYMTNGQEVTITDPSQLTEGQKDTSTMTIPYPYSGSTYLYVIANGTLQLTATPASQGYLVLIVDDSMLISLGSVSMGGSGGQMSGGNMSGSMSGGFSGGASGGVTIAPTFEPYDLTEYTVLTVTPSAAMTLDITVDELDISKISAGLEADITVTALSGEEFKGTVTEIGTATNSGGNSKFTVTITMDRSGDMLSGMSACAAMSLGTVDNALIIPAAALNDDGSRVFVYTSYDGKNDVLGDPVEVTVGVSDGENVQILSGLEAGDTFCYSYYDAQETK